MQLWTVPAAVVLLALTGCAKKAEEAALPDGGAPHGRGKFVGVGIYTPSRLWEHLAAEAAVRGAEDAPPNPAAATLKDDSEIIVVLDSNTGRLRQCGNLSGVCVGMDPWSKPLTASRTGAVQFSKHEADLQRETDAAAAQEDAEADRQGRARVSVRVKAQ